MVAADIACDRFAIFIVNNAAERNSSLHLSKYSEEGFATPKTWASVWSKRYEMASNVGTSMSKIDIRDIACPNGTLEYTRILVVTSKFGV